jgi:hypothetical protein
MTSDTNFALPIVMCWFTPRNRHPSEYAEATAQSVASRFGWSIRPFEHSFPDLSVALLTQSEIFNQQNLARVKQRL